MNTEQNKRNFEIAKSEIERESNATVVDKIKQQIKNSEALAKKKEEVESSLIKLNSLLDKQNQVLKKLEDGDTSEIDFSVGINLTKPHKENIFQEILDRLIIVLNPCFWVMTAPYSKKWDEELNNLMSENKFHRISECEFSLGENEIWGANYPYGAFTYGECEVRPSRLTILRARRKLVKDLGE